MRYAITLKIRWVIHFSSTYWNTIQKHIHLSMNCCTFQMNYINGQTEPNLYCQSKIIQLENQNTKPNLAFNERLVCKFFFSSLFGSSFSSRLTISRSVNRLYLHFYSNIFFALNSPPLPSLYCIPFSNGIHFLINFRTFVFIYLADYFYCCRFASYATTFNWIPNLFSDIVVLWRIQTHIAKPKSKNYHQSQRDEWITITNKRSYTKWRSIFFGLIAHKIQFFFFLRCLVVARFIWNSLNAHIFVTYVKITVAWEMAKCTRKLSYFCCVMHTLCNLKAKSNETNCGER